MSMTKTRELSKRLKAYHARRSNELGYVIKQRELADEFGVEPGLFNKHYNGTRTPEDVYMIARYAEKLGDDLYAVLGVQPPTPQDQVIATLVALRNSEVPEVQLIFDELITRVGRLGLIVSKDTKDMR